MAYVPGFENDIFISYAHADNTEGWVSSLETRLKNRLQQLDRKTAVTIWRDPKLGGADIFSDRIYKQIKASALMVSILSPNGLDSNWCQQERQRFEQAAPATGGFRLSDDKIRAIKVVKTPSLEDRHRSIFGTLGYEFYRRSEETGRFREFHPTSPEFDEKLNEMAQDVWDLLSRLKTRALTPARNLAIYVAITTSDLQDWRDPIVQQLTAWNCRVLPESPLPTASEALRAAIDEALGACVLSVHCLGPKVGFTAEDEVNPIDVLQLLHARAKGLERLVFQAPSLHNLAQQVSQTVQGKGFEESLKPLTIDVLLQALEDRVKALRAAPTFASTLPTVYVVCAPSEWDDALRLKSCLEANRRFAALLPIRDVDDERVRLRHHREDLKSSDAVVVYWGRAGESWFRDQFRELIGARKKRRNTALPALCLSCPPDQTREQYRRPDLHFEQVADLNCATTLRPLFRCLETVPDGGGE
jgi:hypothetical protein